jgi:hypothetical protein
MDTNELMNKTINETLIQTAYSKQIKLHLILTNRTWRNGFVVKTYPDFFEFKDTENPKEVFFYSQIKKVEPFTEPRGK